MAETSRHEEGAAPNDDSQTAPLTSSTLEKAGFVVDEPTKQRRSHVTRTRPSPAAGRRINPDSLKTLWFTVGAVAILGLTSFMVSFNGLHDVAAWVGLPWWMRWAVPVFIDIAILAYSMAAVIHRARGEATWPTWLTLGVFTVVSVVANAAHALAKGEGETAVQSWIGAGIASMAPLAVFAATEQISRLAFATDTAPQYMPQEEPVTAEELTPAVAVPEPVAAPRAPQRAQLDPVVSEPETMSQAPEAEPFEESDPETAEEATAAEPEIEEAAEEPPAASTEPTPETTGQPVAPAPEPAQEPSQEPADAPQPSTGEDEDPDGFIAWVRGQVAAGESLTGATAGAFLGKSDRTGRNRLNALRDERPEIFEGEK
ncbi:DUF2637 domain-containing protein [Kocuria rhizophila]|uniref:DUF2637 domain-containing protein n=1 Tax=Kocuria rhizophila TaxID=72000 RepID=A0AAX2SEX5_KOCRH|nr:DUF2637 domain-containing protein [Kocuria rhizophila]TFI09624.1 DUF2637 domain-containing protein [Kocuria rhizophila]